MVSGLDLTYRDGCLNSWLFLLNLAEYAAEFEVRIFGEIRHIKKRTISNRLHTRRLGGAKPPTNSSLSSLDISAKWRDSNILRTRLARGHLSTRLLIRIGSSFNRLKGCFPPEDVIFVETVDDRKSRGTFLWGRQLQAVARVCCRLLTELVH